MEDARRAVNVTSRTSSVDWNGQRMMGLNNIELITDRPLDVNLREISESEVDAEYKRYSHRGQSSVARGPMDFRPSIQSTRSLVSIWILTPRPQVDGLSAHGGYCGPAVKLIALPMAQQLAADAQVGLPISGIGGVSSWREAAEFLLLGATTCRSVRRPCIMATGLSRI
jgi:hypothetical protein